jgi:hypothetical protein
LYFAQHLSAAGKVRADEDGALDAQSFLKELLPHCRSGFKKGWAQFRQGTTATVRGVGFFDLVHGSDLHGVAANEVELHPVLAFQGSC